MQTDQISYSHTKRDAAKFLGVAEGTLNRWITQGRGPRHTKMGGKVVRFRLKDLIDWAETQPTGGEVRPAGGTRGKNRHSL